MVADLYNDVISLSQNTRLNIPETQSVAHVERLHLTSSQSEETVDVYQLSVSKPIFADRSVVLTVTLGLNIETQPSASLEKKWQKIASGNLLHSY